MKSGKCQEKAWKVVEESVCVCLINVSGRYWGLMWLFFCKLLIYFTNFCIYDILQLFSR